MSRSFEETVLFLKDYSWIFNFKVTEILCDETINKIPVQWQQYLSQTTLNRFDEKIMQLDTDDNLEHVFFQDFKSRLKQITLRNAKYRVSMDDDIEEKNTSAMNNKNAWKGHSKKKIHEVKRFSQFISEKHREIDETCIVDVGSGLGYLDERLIDDGFDVVGIECSQSFHNSAIERHKKRKYTGASTMNHIHMNFSDDPECLKVVSASIPEGKAGCLIALHACADLTNQIIKAFIASPKIRSLAVISCCYHKMDNFPISEELKEVSEKLNVDFYNHFFLRLGANEPLSRWLNMSIDDHNEHSNNVLFRAVLELYSKQKSLELKKKRRKATKSSETKDFQGYVHNIQNIYDLNLTEEDKSNLLSLYEKKKNLHQFVENLTGLQFLVQQVIEQLILTDRIAYLKEQLDFSVRLRSKENDSTETRCKETFTETKCKETDFTETRCKETDSTETRCKETDFTETRCKETDFTETRCKEADFTETRCKEADFTGKRCKENDFTETTCKETCLADKIRCKETDLYEVELIDLFDDLISPRNTVIYAKKM